MRWNTLTLLRSLSLVVCGLLVSAVGCSSQPAWQTDTQPVQGTLTINGEPAQGAIVTLHPLGDAVDIRKSKPWGVVNQDGAYQLRTYEKNDGAPTGKYQVTFIWQEDFSVMGSPDQLRGAFNNPAKSEWTFSIDQGTSQLPPIDVTGAKVSSAPKRSSRKPTPFDDPG